MTKITNHPLEPERYRDPNKIPTDDEVIQAVLADMPNYYKMSKAQQEACKKHLKGRVAEARQAVFYNIMGLVSDGIDKRDRGEEWTPEEFASDLDYMITAGLISAAL